MLNGELALEPVPVGCLVCQAWRGDGQRDAQDARIDFAGILCRERNPLRAGGLGGELDVGFVLLGHEDNGIALDNCLAAEQPAIRLVTWGDSSPTAVTNGTALNPDSAATTAALPATRQVENHAGPHRGVGEERSDLNLRDLARG
jgi:hypothetical protein